MQDTAFWSEPTKIARTLFMFRTLPEPNAHFHVGGKWRETQAGSKYKQCVYRHNQTKRQRRKAWDVRAVTTRVNRYHFGGTATHGHVVIYRPPQKYQPQTPGLSPLCQDDQSCPIGPNHQRSRNLLNLPKKKCIREPSNLSCAHRGGDGQAGCPSAQAVSDVQAAGLRR